MEGKNDYNRITVEEVTWHRDKPFKEDKNSDDEGSKKKEKK